MTLVTSLSRILHVSEHELLTASDDMHQREIEERSTWISESLKGYAWVPYAIWQFGSMLCGNLVTDHRLS